MGEQAQRGYAEAELEAFRSLPLRVRIKARLLAVLVTASLAASVLLLSLGHLLAETVVVKYRGPVDLATFDCKPIAGSTLVNRICYNADHRYMVIDLRGTWYHYCEVDGATVAAFLASNSKGRFYNQSIKDSGSGGLFSCRDKVVPQL